MIDKIRAMLVDLEEVVMFAMTSECENVQSALVDIAVNIDLILDILPDPPAVEPQDFISDLYR